MEVVVWVRRVPVIRIGSHRGSERIHPLRSARRIMLSTTILAGRGWVATG